MLPHIDAAGVIVTTDLIVLAAVVIVDVIPMIVDSMRCTKERKKKYCDAFAEGLE